MLAAMRFRTLFLAGLLVVAAASLGRALLTRDGVGPIEYVVGTVVVVALLVGALRLSRRAIGRA
jgi:hypothetical protein